MTVFHLTDMAIAETAIDGLRVITMKQVTDDRGTVREFFRESAYAEILGANTSWRQVNVTSTGYRAIRGMHGEAMTKLVTCVSGTVFGAYLDARSGSPTFGKVVSVELAPGSQVLVPAGVCNGFQSLSEAGTQYLYCFTSEWVPGMAGTAFNPLDPGLAIEWPLAVDTADPAQISAKDANAPMFSAS